MNLQARLRSQVGSVTAESALSLAAIFMVVVLMLQSFSVVFVYLQLQQATNEASHIASAFGSVSEQHQRAELFLSSYIPKAQSSVEITDTLAIVKARQQIQILSFSFTINAHSMAGRWDNP